MTDGGDNQNRKTKGRAGAKALPRAEKRASWGADPYTYHSQQTKVNARRSSAPKDIATIGECVHVNGGFDATPFHASARQPFSDTTMFFYY